MSLLGNLGRAIAGNNGQIMLSINDLCEQVEIELRYNLTFALYYGMHLFFIFILSSNNRHRVPVGKPDVRKFGSPWLFPRLQWSRPVH